MPASLVRIARSVVVATAATLLLVAPVAAKEPIDPNTLNPPPPAAFNPTCERVVKGIICELAFSDPSIVDEPSGIVCGETELLVSQDRSVVGRRIYDAEGDLLKRHFGEDFTGSFSNPATGQTVVWVSHATVIHTLASPGDIASGRTTSSGLSIRISAPGVGTVLLDAGRLLIDEATGEIIASAGPHNFDDYFLHGDVDALQPLCDALA